MKDGMKDDANMTPGQALQARILTDELKLAADDVDAAADALAVAFMRAEDIQRRLLPLVYNKSRTGSGYDRKRGARVVERCWGSAMVRCRELIGETLGFE